MLGSTRDQYASERDFYRRLLDLGNKHEIEPLLDDALALIVEVTSANTAYVELYDGDSTKPRFWKGHRLRDATISRGIISRAVADGQTIETPSATTDDRFSELGSVRQHDIQAVLCAPVGLDPVIGVIYLQGRTKPGMFSSQDRECLELFARQLAPLTDRLVRRSTEGVTDYTREVRKELAVPEIIGRSAPLARLLHSVRRVAHLDVDVLITGPSGTGKSMLARAIVNNSPRQGGPFVEVNCATLQEALFENELFGSERGAHSTATRRAEGKVGVAAGGTIFLDEIADLPYGSQAKLLKLLEEREYHPLGATSSLKADVRFISATNQNLEQLVAERRFREDLLYRLDVFRLEVPALELRADDIPELVEHFVAEICKKHRLPAMDVSRRALVACQQAKWPGHTRQLRNVVERAVINANGEKTTTLTEQHLFPKDEADAPSPPSRPTLETSTREFRCRTMQDALEANDWNVSRTARQLGLARSHIYNLMREFDLRREAGKKGGDNQGGKE